MNPQQKIPNEIRLKYNEERHSPSTNVLLDVEFTFSNSESDDPEGARTTLRAHKFVLLDSPQSQFFTEKIGEQVGLIVIEVPNNGINAVSVDAIIDYIYGVPLYEIANAFGFIDSEQLPTGDGIFDLDGFLKAANFFQMEIKLLLQLSTILNQNHLLQLGNYVCNNFERLKTNSKFWDIETAKILELCQALDPETIEDALLDWIYEDKVHRRDFLDKLGDLRRLHLNQNQGFVNGNRSDTEQEHEEHNSANEADSDSESNEIPTAATHSHSQTSKSPSNTSASTRLKKRPMSNGVIVNNNIPPKIQRICPKPKLVVNLHNLQSKSNGEVQSVQPVKTCQIKRTKKSTHKPVNKMERFFNNQLTEIQVDLTRGTWNTNKFAETWRTVWEYISLSNKGTANVNKKRFLQGNGPHLLLESRRKLEPQYHLHLDNLDTFRTAWLFIVFNLQKSEYISSVFTDEFIQCLLKDLENDYDFYDCTVAAEILSRFLNYYSTNEDWNLNDVNTARELVSNKIKATIIKSDFNSTSGRDREVFYTALPQMDDLFELIESADPTANLCGLWLLTFHTQTNTTSKVCNDEARRYLSWFKKSNTKDKLKKFTNQKQEQDPHISTYAKELLKRIGSAA